MTIRLLPPPANVEQLRQPGAYISHGSVSALTTHSSRAESHRRCPARCSTRWAPTPAPHTGLGLADAQLVRAAPAAPDVPSDLPAL